MSYGRLCEVEWTAMDKEVAAAKKQTSGEEAICAAGRSEFVTTKEARRRLHAYDELASTTKVSPALLVVREHLPSGKACLRVNIDATNIGNVARFINHSCDGGNLMAVLVRNSGSFLPRLCFFAALDISEGEELTFSYGDARLRRKDSPCFCRKEACLGFLPSEET
ncbi:Histone-lysine N-methyltransferase SUVR3 [Platanthera zijinensis]|uniref:Histone-lysine N-methyltransferase SUVR3 n=1 Tax=Platanthera zijinensis TaxID=2320716 RepID=A0AAP0BJM9_9ASPA